MSQLIKQDKPLTDGRMSHDQKIVDFSVDMATFVVELRVGSWVGYVEGTTPDAITIYKLTNFTDWQPEHAQQLDDLLQALPEWAVSTELYTPEQAISKMSTPLFKSHWDELTRVWVDDRTLLEVQDQKWTEIKTARSAKENEPFFYNGIYFDSDTKRISGAAIGVVMLQMQNLPYLNEWTTSDNTVVQVDGPYILGMAGALTDKIKGLFEVARLKRVSIYSAISKEAIETITWDSVETVE